MKMAAAADGHKPTQQWLILSQFQRYWANVWCGSSWYSSITHSLSMWSINKLFITLKRLQLCHISSWGDLSLKFDKKGFLQGIPGLYLEIYITVMQNCWNVRQKSLQQLSIRRVYQTCHYWCLYRPKTKFVSLNTRNCLYKNLNYSYFVVITKKTKKQKGSTNIYTCLDVTNLRFSNRFETDRQCRSNSTTWQCPFSAWVRL